MADRELDTLITQAAEAGELSDGDLRRLWSIAGLAGDAGDYLTFEEAFLSQLPGAEDENLAFRPGGWVVNASSSVVKAALTTALLTVGLVTVGAAGVPLLVVSAVLPLLIDVERVQLTAGEGHLLATLSLTGDAEDLSAEELYAQLPDHLQEQVTEMAFRDFLDKCINAGVADAGEDEDGGTSFTIHDPDRARFRISFT